MAHATRPSLTSNQVAPTDPEVPSAKRRGAWRRQRSLLGVTALMCGLLSITVFLLYRASRHVGSSRAVGSPLSGAPSTTDALVHPLEMAPASTMTGLRPPAPMPYRGDLDDESARDDDGSSIDSAAASSNGPQPKAPPPAVDIIRTPAF